MKKFLVMAVMAIMALGVSAQVYVGGSLGYTHAKTDLGSGDQFTIAPEIGYNLNDSWAIGAGYARYTYFRTDLVSLFVDGGVDLGFSKPDEGDTSVVWGIGLKPGISLNLNEKFSLVAHMGFLGYQDLKERGKVYGIDLHNNLSFGFYYNF